MSDGPGFLLGLWWRRVVWMVHCGGCVPSVVSVPLWTVRGRG